MQSEIDTTILEMVASDENGVSTELICRFTRKTPQELGGVFETLLAQHRVLGFAGLWFSKEAFDKGTELFKNALRELHTANPTESDQPPQRVASAAGLRWTGKPLDRIVSHLAAIGVIDGSPSGVRDREFQLELTPRQRALLDRVITQLEQEAVSTPSPQGIAESLGVPRQAIVEILRLGERSGEVIQIADAVYYTPRQIEQLKEQIRSIAAGQPFASTALRDAMGTTRKYVLPILEYFDSVGFTVKEGTTRTIVSQSTR